MNLLIYTNGMTYNTSRQSVRLCLAIALNLSSECVLMKIWIFTGKFGLARV